MAMNEDSVVSSLNELRRMANERARRESEQRARAEAERRAFEDRGRASRRSESRSRVVETRNDPRSDPRTRTLTEGFPEAAKATAEGFSSMVRWEQNGEEPSPAPEQGMYAQTAPIGSQEWRAVRPEPMASAPSGRRSVMGPVLLTTLVLGTAMTIGYFTLRQDFQTTLRMRDQNIARLEETKNQAVEAAARAEQQAKVQANLFDQRMRAQMAPGGGAASSAPAAVASTMGSRKWAAANAAAAAAAAAPKPAPARFHRRWWRPRGAGRRGAAAAAGAAVAPEDRKGPLPNIARKKKISDDPLAGLKL